MRFVDEATITVRAGKGGNGCVSFRREKFIPKGGPDGGDGGNGGSVFFRGSSKLLSLYDFRLKRNYAAENGQPGQGRQKFGRKGEPLVLDLPVGTLVYRIHEDGHEELIADLSEPEEKMLIAQGGIGGHGNEFFKSATMRTPRFAQPGEPGEEMKVRLELKMLADVGLLGLPNAGKSTFISKVSAAKPKIANYAFTTLTPNLGVMISEWDPERRLIIADIPGLIEGAHEGQGLGHRFLKHVERTRFLVHILSVEDVDPEDPWAGFELINDELVKFNETLGNRHQIELINKIDTVDDEKVALLKQKAEEDGRNVFFVSALHEDGLEDVVKVMWDIADAHDRNVPLSTAREEIIEEEVVEEVEVIWTRE